MLGWKWKSDPHHVISKQFVDLRSFFVHTIVEWMPRTLETLVKVQSINIRNLFEDKMKEIISNLDLAMTASAADDFRLNMHSTYKANLDNLPHFSHFTKSGITRIQVESILKVPVHESL